MSSGHGPLVHFSADHSFLVQILELVQGYFHLEFVLVCALVLSGHCNFLQQSKNTLSPIGESKIVHSYEWESENQQDWWAVQDAGESLQQTPVTSLRMNENGQSTFGIQMCKMR